MPAVFCFAFVFSTFFFSAALGGPRLLRPSSHTFLWAPSTLASLPAAPKRGKAPPFAPLPSSHFLNRPRTLSSPLSLSSLLPFGSLSFQAHARRELLIARQRLTRIKSALDSNERVLLVGKLNALKTQVASAKLASRTAAGALRALTRLRAQQKSLAEARERRVAAVKDALASTVAGRVVDLIVGQV